MEGLRALVTGASSGIGAAIARDLAGRGASLVLTARRKEPMQRLADELGVPCDIVVADLGLPGAGAAVWSSASASGAIDIVVNNAGFGYFRRFDQAEWARDSEMLHLNIASLVELSRRFVDARKGASGPGYLLNIASIAAYQSVPHFAVYASTKAFVRNFTEALHDELKGSPTSATCVCPGGTRTPFHDAAGAGDYGWLANASMMSAEEVAAISVRAMLSRKRTVIPGLLNKLSCWGVRFVPRSIASWMSTKIMGTPKRALPPRGAAA